MEGNNNSYQGKGPLDAFLNLLSLITLGWLSISFGGILYQLINNFFGPERDYYPETFSQGALKFNIASVIILTPIFLAVIGYLHQQYKKNQLNHQSGIYRWLTYLMLLISALNIIGSLIALIWNFLNGSYTLAIILKILTVFVIAAGIFGYYWYDLRRQDYNKRSLISVAFFVGVIVLILASVISGVMIIDSPQQARLTAFDQARTDDLSNIYYSLQADFQNNGVLPADLSAPKYAGYQDPQTGQTYEYRKLANDQYEICAVFSLAAINDQKSYPGQYDWYYHNAGRQCFIQKVESTLVKPVEPMPVAQ